MPSWRCASRHCEARAWYGRDTPLDHHEQLCHKEFFVKFLKRPPTTCGEQACPALGREAPPVRRNALAQT